MARRLFVGCPVTRCARDSPVRPAAVHTESGGLETTAGESDGYTAQSRIAPDHEPSTTDPQRLKPRTRPASPPAPEAFRRDIRWSRAPAAAPSNPPDHRTRTRENLVKSRIPDSLPMIVPCWMECPTVLRTKSVGPKMNALEIARWILGGALLLLGLYVAGFNWASIRINRSLQRNGIDRHVSMAPLVAPASLLLGLIALPFAKSWYAWLLPIVDPSLAILIVSLPLLVKELRGS